MFTGAVNNDQAKTTSYKAVLPFYVYAGLSFFAATLLLLFSTQDFPSHYFQPNLLSIVHIMALGWGTMIIMGASHQLIPVFIEGALYSTWLAYACFFLAATGIPMLAWGFYHFNMGWPAQCGGELIVAAIIVYVINLSLSISRSKHGNVHAWFILAAAIWLLLTAVAGLLLVYNFSYNFLPANSVAYLPLHAHLGIAGWFLLLVIGTASRLIPLFLISKYNNTATLWWIFGLVNGAVISFLFIFFSNYDWLQLIPVLAISAALVLFGRFCYRAYIERIRKKVDEQMNVSLLSVVMMFLPLVFLVIITGWMLVTPAANSNIVIVYGFLIFFGWLTAIILGMTFKTLPFIIWNKVYQQLAGRGKTPNPKDLFSNRIFSLMSVAYLIGFVLFIAGVLIHSLFIIKAGAVFLLLTAFLYNWNMAKLLLTNPGS